MYTAINIAKYIISYYYEHKRTVSNLKLQKLLYFIQAEFLVAKGERCFKEKIEAWDFGPVVPEVYKKYQMYGGANIPVFKTLEYGYISPDDKKLIDGILDECAPYSAAALVEITQNQRPWKVAYYGDDKEVRPDLIKEYFGGEAMAVKTIYTCDRCGKEFQNASGLAGFFYDGIRKKNKIDFHLGWSGSYGGYSLKSYRVDLCGPCAEKLLDFLRNKEE